jgi:ABC-type nitrate/sulfonate/bicarbonate transport system substrate-binding protein
VNVICLRLSLVIVFLLLPRFGPAQTKEKVRVALGSISVNTSVIPVGHQYGIFAKYGVDLEPIYMGE